MNRFNPFIGYQPGSVPGTYQFQREGGNPLLFGGQTAEDLRKRIDAAKNFGPQRTASLGPGGAPGAAANLTPGGVPPGAVPPARLTPGGTAATPQPPPASPDDVASMVRDLTGAEPGKQEGQPARPQPLAQPPGGTQDYDPWATDSKGRTIYLRRGADPKNPSANDMFVMVPGTRATRGGWIPVSRSKEGGYAVDEEHLNELQGQSDITIEGLEMFAGAESEQAQQEASELDKQADAAARAQDAQLRQLDKAQARMNHARTLYDDYNAKVKEQKIDPDRIYRGSGGTTKRIFDTLASALAGFGAGYKGTRNPIADRIQAEREADIAAQERDLLKKEQSRDTALKYFYQETGNMDAARNAVRALQAEQNVKQLERIAALAKDPKAKAAALQSIAAERTNMEKYREAYVRLSAGQVSATEKYVPGSPGSPARRVPLSLSDRGALEGQLLRGDKAAGGGKNALAMQEGTVAQVTKQLEGYPDDYVPPVHEARNLLSRAGETFVDFLAGAGTYVREFMSPEEQKAVQDALQADQAIASAANTLEGQGAMGVSEQRVRSRATSPNATMGDKKRALAILNERVQAVKAAGGGQVAAPTIQVEGQ